MCLNGKFHEHSYTEYNVDVDKLSFEGEIKQQRASNMSCN